MAAGFPPFSYPLPSPPFPLLLSHLPSLSPPSNQSLRPHANNKAYHLAYVGIDATVHTRNNELAQCEWCVDGAGKDGHRSAIGRYSPNLPYRAMRGLLQSGKGEPDENEWDIHTGQWGCPFVFTN